MSSKNNKLEQKSKYNVNVKDCNICYDSKDVNSFIKCQECNNIICDECYSNIFENSENCPYCRRLLDIDEIALELYYNFDFDIPEKKQKVNKLFLYIFIIPISLLIFILFVNIGYIYRSIFSLPYDNYYKFTLDTIVAFCEGIIFTFILLLLYNLIKCIFKAIIKIKY